jgi:hypothetical protein
MTSEQIAAVISTAPAALVIATAPMAARSRPRTAQP